VKDAEILYLIICRPPIIDFTKVAVIKNYGLLFCANPNPWGCHGRRKVHGKGFQLQD